MRHPAAEAVRIDGLRPSRRRAEPLALPAGWAAAAAVLAPPIMSAGADDRAAPLLLLLAVLLWWVAVVVVIRSDLRDFIIPDEASLAVAVLGVGVAAGLPWLSGEGVADAALAGGEALASGGVAFALFGLVGTAFRRFGRDALGFGDVKLAAASAMWLTPGDAAIALEMAALGAIAMLLLRRRGAALRDTAVPFGAFLAPAAWLVFVLGPAVRDAAGLLPW